MVDTVCPSLKPESLSNEMICFSSNDKFRAGAGARVGVAGTAGGSLDMHPARAITAKNNTQTVINFFMIIPPLA